MTNPRRPQTLDALAGFYDRVRRGKVPKKRRYARVVGGVVGARQHARRKRQAAARRSGNWQTRPTTLPTGRQVPRQSPLWRPRGS